MFNNCLKRKCMKKIKEMKEKIDCHVMSNEELKAIRGGAFKCYCGGTTYIMVESIEECWEYCEKMQ